MWSDGLGIERAGMGKEEIHPGQGHNPIARLMEHGIWEPKRAAGHSVGFSKGQRWRELSSQRGLLTSNHEAQSSRKD